MVLNIRFALAALALGACSPSLFDNQKHRGSAGGGDDGPDGGTPVATTCTAPCLADAAADFNGTPTGATGHWRYLEDHRDRTWTAMSGDASALHGADPANQITTCGAQASAPACAQLPGALLMSSSGATSAADPALELTVPTSQGLALSLRALVPAGGPDQQIRIYRNSREDALYTATAIAGTPLEQLISFDALAGDRLLVAVVPTAAGASNVALQLFANPTQAAFPSTCQLAITFESVAGNTVANACGSAMTHAIFDGADSPPRFGPGPFPELGQAADLAETQYFYSASVINRSHDTTLQFWMKFRGIIEPYDAWPFSDLDLDQPGGLGFALTEASPLRFDAQTTTAFVGNNIETADGIAPYPTDGGWHFMRVVHTGGNVAVCVDGKRMALFALPEGHLQSTYSPWLGANQRWSPQGGYYNGLLDDVRIYSQALPCDP